MLDYDSQQSYVDRSHKTNTTVDSSDSFAFAPKRSKKDMSIRMFYQQEDILLQRADQARGELEGLERDCDHFKDTLVIKDRGDTLSYWPCCIAHPKHKPIVLAAITGRNQSEKLVAVQEEIVNEPVGAILYCHINSKYFTWILLGLFSTETEA